MEAQIKQSMIGSTFYFKSGGTGFLLVGKAFYSLTFILEGSSVILNTLWGKEEYRDKSQENGIQSPLSHQLDG